MRRWIIAALLLVLLAATPGLVAGIAPVGAQSGPSFNLGWHVIAGGGAPVTSAHYAVNATMGQTVASPPPLAGDHYVVSGGFWFSLLDRIELFLPLIFK